MHSPFGAAHQCQLLRRREAVFEVKFWVTTEPPRLERRVLLPYGHL